DVGIPGEGPVMKRGLNQFPLLLPERAVARQQAFAGKRVEGALQQPRLMEFLGLLDEDLPRKVGMRQLIDAQRADLVVDDVAERARVLDRESEGIEREKARQHLRDAGQ